MYRGGVGQHGKKIEAGAAQPPGRCAQRRGHVTFMCPEPVGFVLPVSRSETTFDLTAYRRPSRSRITRTSFSVPLNNRTSLFAEFERQDTNWFYKNYPNDIWSIGVIHDMR